MIEWDRDAVQQMADESVRSIAAQAMPILRKSVKGRFKIDLHGAEVVSDTDGLIAEYGTITAGDPWVFPALNDVAEAMRGTH